MMRQVILALALAASNSLSLNMMAAGIKVGEKIPAIDLDFGFPPEKINLATRVAGKRTLLVGLPGAFTPT